MRVTLCFQFSSVAQSCPTLCDPMNHSTPGRPVHHQLPEFTQTHVHWVRDSIQPPRPLLSPSPPVPNPSQLQSLFQWVNSSHEVAKVLEFQPQHQFSVSFKYVYTYSEINLTSSSMNLLPWNVHFPIYEGKISLISFTIFLWI